MDKSKGNTYGLGKTTESISIGVDHGSGDSHQAVVVMDGNRLVYSGPAEGFRGETIRAEYFDEAPRQKPLVRLPRMDGPEAKRMLEEFTKAYEKADRPARIRGAREPISRPGIPLGGVAGVVLGAM